MSKLELIGEVEDFIYQNDSNSYTIAVFLTENKDIVTVVGYLPFISVRRLFKNYWQNGNSSRIWRTV